MLNPLKNCAQCCQPCQRCDINQSCLFCPYSHLQRVVDLIYVASMLLDLPQDLRPNLVGSDEVLVDFLEQSRYLLLYPLQFHFFCHD